MPDSADGFIPSAAGRAPLAGAVESAVEIWASDAVILFKPGGHRFAVTR